MSYLLRFEVEADDEADAFAAAAAKLAKGVLVNGVHEARLMRPGWWSIVLHVWEDI